jgi:hypothetical protein
VAELSSAEESTPETVLSSTEELVTLPPPQAERQQVAANSMARILSPFIVFYLFLKEMRMPEKWILLVHFPGNLD